MVTKNKAIFLDLLLSDIFINLKMKANLKYQIDSLNVSNASSIALYEFYKDKN